MASTSPRAPAQASSAAFPSFSASNSLADRRHRRGVQYALRTLARLRRIANKVPADQLAAALLPHLGRGP